MHWRRDVHLYGLHIPTTTSCSQFKYRLPIEKAVHLIPAWRVKQLLLSNGHFITRLFFCLMCHYFAEIPPRVTRTNLNASQYIELKDNLTIFCKSQGNPETKTLWFKVGTPCLGARSQLCECKCYCHMLVIRDYVLINNLIYWTLLTRTYR
jgi:hypothetical protein